MYPLGEIKNQEIVRAPAARRLRKKASFKPPLSPDAQSVPAPAMLQPSANTPPLSGTSESVESPWLPQLNRCDSPFMIYSDQESPVSQPASSTDRTPSTQATSPQQDDYLYINKSTSASHSFQPPQDSQSATTAIRNSTKNLRPLSVPQYSSLAADLHAEARRRARDYALRYPNMLPSDFDVAVNAMLGKLLVALRALGTPDSTDSAYWFRDFAGTVELSLEFWHNPPTRTTAHDEMHEPSRAWLTLFALPVLTVCTSNGPAVGMKQHALDEMCMMLRDVAKEQGHDELVSEALLLDVWDALVDIMVGYDQNSATVAFRTAYEIMQHAPLSADVVCKVVLLRGVADDYTHGKMVEFRKMRVELLSLLVRRITDMDLGRNPMFLDCLVDCVTELQQSNIAETNAGVRAQINLCLSRVSKSVQLDCLDRASERAVERAMERAGRRQHFAVVQSPMRDVHEPIKSMGDDSLPPLSAIAAAAVAAASATAPPRPRRVSTQTPVADRFISEPIDVNAAALALDNAELTAAAVRSQRIALPEVAVEGLTTEQLTSPYVDCALSPLAPRGELLQSTLHKSSQGRRNAFRIFTKLGHRSSSNEWADGASYTGSCTSKKTHGTTREKAMGYFRSFRNHCHKLRRVRSEVSIGGHVMTWGRGKTFPGPKTADLLASFDDDTVEDADGRPFNSLNRAISNTTVSDNVEFPELSEATHSKFRTMLRQGLDSLRSRMHGN